jgi:hypothetical protein
VGLVSKIVFLHMIFFKRELEVPFAIYADFECILKNVDTCLPQPSMSSTTTIQQHVPCAFAYYMKCSFDDTLNRLRVYKGIDSPTKFVLALSEDIKDLYNNVLMRSKSMFPLNDVEKKYKANRMSVIFVREI